jgi:hypothetical protein
MDNKSHSSHKSNSSHKLNKSHKKYDTNKVFSKKSKIKNKQMNIDAFVMALKPILFETTDINEITSNLKNLCINSIDNIKYESYMKYFVPYNNLSGKSGAILGYLSNNVNTVIKINNMKKDELYNGSLVKSYKSNKCIFLNYKINEIIISLILKNIEYFVNISEIEKKLIKNHVIDTYDYGISNKAVYITMPLVGFNYVNPTTKQEKYLTNFVDLLFYNHIPILKKAYSDDDKHIFELYDIFLCNSLSNYINVIKILQKYLNYMNTDIKLDNVFIRHEKNKDLSLSPLRDKGLLIDLVLLLSDLDKSTIEINDKKILSDHNYLQKLLKMVNVGFTNDIRHSCKSNFSKVCKNISIYNFDILSVYINVYAVLLNEIPNIFNYLPKTNKLVIESANLDDNKFDVFKKLLINGRYKLKSGPVSFRLGQIVKKYCMLLNKL